MAFPNPKQFINRFLKDVFIKTVFKELKLEKKFISYQSHEDTGFVCEAKIKDVKLIEDPLKYIVIGCF